MPRMITSRATAFLTVSLLLGASAPAFAQQTSEVREILGRAQLEAARNVVGDVLGAIAGTSTAQAQTAPQPVRPPTGAATRGLSTPVPAAAAASAATAQGGNPPATTASGTQPTPGVAVAQVQPAQPTQQGQPAAVAPPVEPDMIVRVPDAGAATATQNDNAAPAEATVTGQAATTSAPSGPIAGAAEPIEPAAQGRAVVVRQSPRVHSPRRVYYRGGYSTSRGWCAPTRW